MTDAPSRNGLVAGSSNGAVASAREQAAQSRRRFSPERRRRTRRRRLRGLSRLALLVLVLVVAVWVGTRVANATSNPAAFSEHTYAVRNGDTLRSVANRAYAGNHDTRRLVFLIERRNHLAGADIRPGEKLILPIVAQ
jgi:cell division protein YceG involved in septum cleavage